MKTKTVVEVLAAAAFFYLGKSVINRNPDIYLSSQDFQNMQWCVDRNSDGIIWDNYMSMNDKTIPKNVSNWAIYKTEVKERNKRNGLNGKILVPCKFQATDYPQNP